MSTRDAMAIGTAGYTAMLAVMALEQHGHHARPRSGDGDRRGRRRRLGRGRAAGQARLPGHRLDRPAAGGRLPQGARRQPRSSTARNWPGTPRPLAKERWAGGVDSVGSTTLANVLSMTRYGGAVAACGLAGGMDLPTQRRAVHFARGVAFGHRFRALSAPGPRRGVETAWNPTSIAANLEAMTAEIGLSDVIGSRPARSSEGRVRGRIVVKIG